MGEVTATRRIGGLVLFVVGFAVVAATTSQVVAAADRGDLPMWGLLLAVALFAAAVVLLALLAGGLARWWLTSNAANPYGLPEHRGLARAGGAFFVVTMSLLQPLIALDLSSRTRWAIGGFIVVVFVAFAGIAWPAGRAQRRRVREVRRERGYRLGEQPWSWATHVTFAVIFAVVGLGNLGAALGADGPEVWVYGVGAATGLGFGGSVVWSAVLKWRRERDRSSSRRQEELA